MAITFQSTGTAAGGVASVAIPYPASVAAGDAVLMHVASKPFGSVPTFVNFSNIGSIASGSVANGASTGSVRATIAWLRANGALTGNSTVSVASGSPTIGIMSRWTKASNKGWSLASVTAADTVETGTAVSAVSGSMTVLADDVISILVAIKDDVPNHTSQTVTMSGVTLSAVTWEAKVPSTQGNDAGFYIGRCTVTAGGTGALTYAATSSVSGASSTAVTFTRLREVDPALPGFVPNTLVEPETHGNCKPIIDGNSNRYIVGESNLARGNNPSMYKSDDGGIVWNEVDPTGSDARATTDMECTWVLKDGTSFMAMSTRDDTVWLDEFRMSDHATNPDTWGFNEVVASSLSSSGVIQACSFNRLSDGTYQMFFSDLLNGANNQVGYRKRTATNTYSTKQTFNDGAANVTGPKSVTGASDVTYVFYKDNTADTLYYRTVSADGVTISARVAVASGSGIASDTVPHTNPVYYDDGGTEVIGIAYINDSDILKYREIRNGVLQTEETISTAAITTNPGATDSQSAVAHLAVDQTTVHAMWSRLADGDLMRDTRVSGAWGTDVVTWASGGETGWYIYSDVVTVGSNKLLIYAYDQGTHVDDASNITYNEITLASAVQGSAAASFGFTGIANGVPITSGAAAAAFGFTAAGAGIDRALGAATAVFGFTGSASGVDAALGVAAAAFGFTATASGTVGTPPVTGAAVASFGFAATTSGVPRPLGQAVASLGFAATASGIDRALGTAASTLGFTGTADGVDRAVGAAVAAFGFTGTAAGVPDVHGVALGSLGFTGAAQGFAGSPPVTGVAAGSFGFSATAQGQPRTFGAAVVVLGFGAAAFGRPRVVAVAAASFGFAGSAAGERSTFATVQGSFGFTAVIIGLAIPPIVYGTASAATGQAPTASPATGAAPTASSAVMPVPTATGG